MEAVVDSKVIVTPVGSLTLIAGPEALLEILWGENSNNKEDSTNSILIESARQIEEYFAGRRSTFDLPLVPQGTPFQLKVWNELKAIPYGSTISYGELAVRVGNPKASRAVGVASGKNPFPIVIPCHRVIGASGKLTGFAGGTVTKRKLLDLESSR